MTVFAERARAEILTLGGERSLPFELETDGAEANLILRNPHGGAPIRVYFFDDQFTLEWSEWHTHDPEAKDVVDQVAAIVAGSVVAYLALTADGTTFTSQVALFDEDEWLDWVTAPDWNPRATSFRVDSWSGCAKRIFPPAK